jgi:SpoVK/Ycf46/Vps4 family AAA+-type ATPase
LYLVLPIASERPKDIESVTAQIVREYPYTVIIDCRSEWYSDDLFGDGPLFQLQFPLPGSAQRLRLWQQELQSLPIAGDVNIADLANQFAFSPEQIAVAVRTAHHRALWRRETIDQSDLLAASRVHSQHRLGTLATKIRPNATWDDVVLPDKTLRLLRQIANRLRHHATVFEEWGWANGTTRNQGLFALFQGKSGTGKTMSAEIIAHDLGLDLYQVDLSRMVSKYIGETEKNLDQVFTLASRSNAVLFFDEADALFGKRSEVRDSHDRYANMEISYLLQRMERYDGLVILATNLRNNMDDAFTRRIHFVVPFPFPDAASRQHIWRISFPANRPPGSDIDFEFLAANFPLTGGHIRNIVLQAAFLAVDEGESIRMQHLLQATRQEYEKLGHLIDETLFDEEAK